MADQFDVQPSTLRHAADQFRGEGPDLREAVGRLHAALDGRRPWGGDDPGRAFASQYTPNATALFRAFDQLVAGLDQVAAGLDQMADRYGRSDQASSVDRP